MSARRASLAISIAVVLTAAAAAGDLTSPSFRARGVHIDAGGATLGPSTASQTVSSLSSSTGQPQAVGFAGSSSSLTTAAMGFSALVLSALPTLDPDADARQAFRDNCPFSANPGQEDDGGDGPDSPADGVGNACQCGDVNGDALVDNQDVDAFRAALADPSGQPLTSAAQMLCTLTGRDPADCTIVDVAVLRRRFAAPSLPPGISQSCAAARLPEP